MEKVKLDVLRPWISKKITEYLHIEDDVVVEFVYNQLEDKVNKQRFFLKELFILAYFYHRIFFCMLPISIHVQRRCKLT